MLIKEKIIKYIIERERKRVGLPTLDEERIELNKIIKRKYEIPDRKIVEFNNLIIFELIPKENIYGFKKGLINFVKAFQAYPNLQDIQNIEDFLTIHNEYISADNYGTLATCSFKGTQYNNLVDSIYITGYNISNSFLCVCFSIEVSPAIKKRLYNTLREKQNEIIRYKFPNLRNFLKVWSWGNYTEIIPEVEVKQNAINNLLKKYKDNILDLLNEYIPLTCKEYDIEPLSVEYFDTNISHKEKPQDFWDVFSINKNLGHLSKNGRWAFFIDVSDRCNYKLISNKSSDRYKYSIEEIVKDDIWHYIYFLYETSQLLIFRGYLNKIEKLMINYRNIFIKIISSKYSIRMYPKLINKKNKMVKEFLLFERISNEIDEKLLNDCINGASNYWNSYNIDFFKRFLKKEYTYIVRLNEEYNRIEMLTDDYINISSIKVNYYLQITLLIIAVATLIVGIGIPILTSDKSLEIMSLIDMFLK